MKKTISILTIALMALSASAQNSSFKLVGSLSGTDSLTIKYVEYRPKKKTVIDTIVAKDGRLEYTKILPHAVSANIKNLGDRFGIQMLLVPGEELHLDGTLATKRGRYTIAISGSDFYQKLAKVKEAEWPFLIKECEISENLEAGRISKEESSEAMKENNLNLKNWRREYIAAHTSEPQVYALINFYEDWAEEALNSLSDEVKNGALAVLIEKDIFNAGLLNRQKKAAEAQATKLLEEGKPMPAFCLKQPDRTDFNSDRLRGKYAVIDFWGSWCSWCIKGIPQMKEFYVKNSDRFQFVSIACSDTEKLWNAALEKYEMPWIHVISDDGIVEKQFGVEAFPTKVVVAPDGIVLKVFRGEVPEFYSYIENLH